MKTKVITIKKKGGGSRKQRVQVLASGKFKFIKNKVKSAGSKIKKSTKKRKSSASKQRNTNKQPTRSKGSRKMKGFGSLKTGFKGFLAGTGANELTEESLLLVTDNPLAVAVPGIAVAGAAGWWVGNKSPAGAIGGFLGAGLDIGLKILTNRSSQVGGSRFRL